MAIQLDGTTGISTSGNITAAGTLVVGVFNPTSISATGNVSGTNLNTNGALSVGGNTIVAGDLTVVGNASLSGNIIGDKITNGTTSVEIPVANGNVSFTIGGSTNVVIVSTTGGYVTGEVSATGNITGSNLNATGLSLVSNVLSAINSTSAITTSANVSANNVIATNHINASGNVSGGNVLSAGQLSAIGNATAGNVLTSGILSASGNITGGNIVSIGLISSGGNVTGVNFTTTGVVSSGGNVVSGNVLTTGLISATANITGGNILTNGLVSVTGNVFARGLVNANANGSIDFFNGGTYSANIIFFQQGANGNVTIRVGESITEAPGTFGLFSTGQIGATGNIIGGNLNTAGAVSATGNVIGNNLNAAGLSLSSNVISALNSTSNITTTANIAGSYILGNGSLLTGIDATSIQNGTSNVRVVSSGGNVAIGVGGTSNVAVYATTGEYVTGLISATGNITGNYILGNGSQLTGIDATSIQNGTSNVRVVSSGGNVAIGVGGTSNVAVYATTGEYVTGLISATGNITGGNLATGGTASATGNVTGGNVLTGGLISATGNVTGGNVLTGGLISATGNITGGNLSGTSIVGTLTTAAQTNITSVGTLGSLTVTGNATGGNLQTGGLISATGNITGGNVLGGANVNATTHTGTTVSVTGNITGGNVNTNNIVGTGLTLVSTGDLTLSTTGNINANNEYINNVPQPVQNADAATKQYVDNLVSTAISYHSPVIAATVTTLATATGGVITYAQPNGVANGVGATLTTTGSFNLIDTANIQTIGTRVLVKDEGNAVFNGVYTWANATVIVRATDADTYGAGNPTQLGINDYFFVESGNVNAGAAYIVNAPSGTITFGTSNITFAEFSKAQIYSANTSAGISLNGTVINALVDNVTTAFSTGNIVVKASAQLTTPNIGAATGTSLSTTGNITGGNLSGTSIVGTLTTAAQTNITSVGTLTSLAVTGNISGGNLSGTSIVGTLTTAAQTNITSVGTLGSLAVTGNTTSGNFVGTLNGSGANVTSISADNISSGTLAQARLANASLTVNGTSIALGGSGTVTATATGTLTIGSGLGGTSYNGSTGVTITNTGVTSIVAGTNIAISGGTGAVTVSVTGTVPTATTAGTVTTAAQSNITSVGTLTSLTVSGNSTQANINLTTNSTSIRQTSTAAWSGDAAAGQGKLEYHSNRWYVNAGSDSTLVCTFRRGGTDVASVDNSGVYSGTATTAKYADLSENYAADAHYEPATVLDFGGNEEVTLNTQSNSVRVAGVVSTNPAHLMNSHLEATHVVALALSGRVPTKVTGTIRKGDMMVSDGQGRACACATPAMGTVIGKALENFNGESGTIEIVVGRL